MKAEILRDPVLYIDCTSTVRSGLNTGVQRVLRALIAQAEVFAEALCIECIPVCYQFSGFYRLEDAEAITVDTQAHYTPVDFHYRDIYFCADAFWTMNMHSWYPFLRDRGVSIATLIYDLIPLTHPNFCTEEDVQVFEQALLTVVEHSDLLLCISRQTRQSLIEYCGARGVPFNEAGCPVIPLAPALRPHAPEMSSAPDRLPAHGFFLMVGTVEPRRGYLEALREFRTYWAGGGGGETLLVVGKQGGAAAAIGAELDALNASGAPVIWLQDADDAELAEAYRRAHAVVCPSRVEGYGMSVSEGLAYNGLVLANRLPVFGEFAGALPYYFDIEVAGDLARLLTQANRLQRVEHPVELGSWSETARNIAGHLARIGAVYGKHAAIELTRNSEEAVRWAHWLNYGRPCNPEDLGLWMRYQSVATMHAAMKHEGRNPGAPLSTDFVRWAHVILNGRNAVGEDEVEAWRAVCETGADLCERLRHEARGLDLPMTEEFVAWAQLILFGREELPIEEVQYWVKGYPRRNDYLQALWFQKRSLDAPLTLNLVQWAYALILGRESCNDEETEFWLRRCKTLKELREHLLYEVAQARVKK